MKKIIMLLMFCLCIGLVSGAPSVNSNETSAILTETATVTAVMNESVNATLVVSTASDLSTVFYTETVTTLATTHSFDLTGLTGNTQYYWRIAGNNTNGNYATSIVTFTTDQYKLSNSTVRTILNLFVFIVMGLVVLKLMLPNIGTMSPKMMVVAMATVLILTIFLSQWIAALLSL